MTALLLALLLASEPPRLQASAAGTAEISGVVMTIDTPPVPVRRATLTLSTGPAAPKTVAVSDENGKFTFVGLPAGKYTLTASKGAWLSSEFGSKRPGGAGVPIAVADGQKVSGLTLRMQKGSVLTGTVFDENGQPAPSAIVAVIKVSISIWDGTRTPQITRSEYADARGAFRIWGLTPGEYYVSAVSGVQPGTLNFGGVIGGSPSAAVDVAQTTDDDVQRAQQIARGQSPAPKAALMVNYAPVYYPGVMSVAEAIKIDLGPQQERGGIDIQLRLVPTAKIEGVVTGVDGKPPARAGVMIMNTAPQPEGSIFVLRSTTTDSAGRFTLPSLPPGRHTVFVDARPLFALLEIAVDGRDVSSTIVIDAAPTISGRLVFEGTSTRPANLMSVVPFVKPIGSSAAILGLGGLVEPDGSFTYSYTPGPHRVFGLQSRSWAGLAGSTWWLKSMIANGVDIADVPFEIPPAGLSNVTVTLTDKRSDLLGTFQDASGKPATDFVLIVFPADRKLWLPLSRRIQAVKPAIDGKFELQGLPPGDYLISALTDVEQDQWNDPVFLEQLAAQSPIKVSVAEGEKKVQDIRIGGR